MKSRNRVGSWSKRRKRVKRDDMQDTCLRPRLWAIDRATTDADGTFSLRAAGGKFLNMNGEGIKV